jgi:hypothetical protein
LTRNENAIESFATPVKRYGERKRGRSFFQQGEKGDILLLFECGASFV